MKKSKIQISAKVLDTIAESKVISQNEKLLFLRYVGYMTKSEQTELMALI